MIPDPLASPAPPISSPPRPILPGVALGFALSALLLSAVTLYMMMTVHVSSTGTDFGGATALLFSFGLLALGAAIELVAIILSLLALRWHFHHRGARIACILCAATLPVYVLCFLRATGKFNG